MTEYDSSSDAYEHYMATQNRISQWINTARQHPRDDTYGSGVSHSGNGDMSSVEHWPRGRDGEGFPSYRRGRSPPRNRQHGGYRNREVFTDHPPTRMPQNLMSGPHDNAFDRSSSAYDFDSTNFPRQAYHSPVTTNSAYRSRSQSMVQGASSHDPPFYDQTSPVPSRHTLPQGNIQRQHSQEPIPFYSAASNAGETSFVHRTLASQMTTSDRRYDRHSQYSSRSPSPAHSSSSYASRSVSSRSYSTTSSDSRTSHLYSTVHHSMTGPTFIQPSRNRPIVVPINGGSGGYVVVPAIGQSLQVIVSSKLFPLWSH
ncbi:hypothetical protein B0H34DRAFT_673602 [Crassisporium funariophilum]|nr:hypothetical protein B0H34DRAFT_673602 [Crassisporium funariophilum]